MNSKGNNVFDDTDPSLEEEIKTRPEVSGEGSFAGSASDPEEVEGKDVADMAHEMGLYTDDNDDGNPQELGLGEEVNRAEGVIDLEDEEEEEKTA